MNKDKTMFTEQQLSAIEARGSALLVSAAAGSGKTKVLVERLLCAVTDADNPCDITDFLIITYTRAAASELRSRIQDALTERLAAEPNNRHLRRQATLIYEAEIGTIHSFCSDVLRENALAADLPPDFRVADDGEATLLKSSVLDSLLESLYESIGDAPDFALLVDTMSAGRNDDKLKAMILETHGKLQCHAAPEQWISAQISMLNAMTVLDASETVWGRFIMLDTRRKVLYWLGVMRQLQEDMSSCADFEKAYGASVSESVTGIERFAQALLQDWDTARTTATIDFPRPKNIKGYDELKALRTKSKDALNKLKILFEEASSALLEDLVAVRPSITALLETVMQFDRAYALAKRKRGLADFNDLEHKTAKLLTDNAGEPTALAMAVSTRYTEILIDEYQDVSKVQELIFNAISKQGANIFMVGDVKQSIYRFRLADPTIFLDKYKKYSDLSAAAEGDSRRILLSMNFRSRKGILDAVNDVFKNVLSETFGEMSYTEQEYLRPGRTDALGLAPAVELCVLDTSGIETEEDEESPAKTAVEADYIAQRISATLRDGAIIPDGFGGTRPVAYGDFVILLRSLKNKAEIYERALLAHGIPVATPATGSFFDFPEVTTMISFLSIIDNPRQDVPLIAVLTSRLYGYSPDELSEIRLADKRADYFTALSKAAEVNAKYADFLKQLQEFQNIAPDMPADKLLWQLYNKTDAVAIMSAMPDGKARRNNLMRLISLAAQCERNDYRGLNGFVSYLRRLKDSGKEPMETADSSAGDAVQIMSIHKSKGLEFPIVIVADTAKRFNNRDATSPLLIHADLGIGAKRLELSRRLEYPTLSRMAVSRKLTQEMMSEELRVLYVAMTRAREKLILVVTFSDADRELTRLCKDALTPVPPEVLESAACMASFFLLPVLTRPEAGCLRGERDVILSHEQTESWDIKLVRLTEPPAQHYQNRIHSAPIRLEARQEDVNILVEKLSFKYPYNAAAMIPSKLTATGLKGRLIDLEAAEEAELISKVPQRVKASPFRPSFQTQKGKLTSAEQGTALHLAMQYIDYDKCTTTESVALEIARLESDRFLSHSQAESIRPERISRFFSSSLGQRILTAEKLYREFKFSLLVKARDYYEIDSDDDILLQGVIDCSFIERGELNIVEYKTDFVTEATLEEKQRLYKPQLNAYASAMARILGIPVAGRYIYFFSINSVCEVSTF